MTPSSPRSRRLTPPSRLRTIATPPARPIRDGRFSAKEILLYMGLGFALGAGSATCEEVQRELIAVRKERA